MGNKSALLVIDVQYGMFQKSTPVYQGEAMLDKITALVERARAEGAAVIFVQHSDERFLVKGTPAWQLHPRLQALTPDCTVHKLQGNAFLGTDLQEILKSRGVENLVICGMVTHGCVKASTLGALELGYPVTLVSDGHSSFSKDAPDLIEKWNSRLQALGAKVEDAMHIEF